MRLTACVLALLLAAAPAVAQKHAKRSTTPPSDRLPGAVDHNPYPPPYSASPDTPLPERHVTASPDNTYHETSGTADAGLTGQADLTLEEIVEQPARRVEGTTYILEGLRVSLVERVTNVDRLYIVRLDEPRTDAHTSSYLSRDHEAVNVVFFGPELREAMRAEPSLLRFPARVRCQWRAVDLGDRTVYGLFIYSVEWIDDKGALARVVRSE